MMSSDARNRRRYMRGHDMNATTGPISPSDDSGLPAYIRGIHRSVYAAAYSRKAQPEQLVSPVAAYPKAA